MNQPQEIAAPADGVFVANELPRPAPGLRRLPSRPLWWILGIGLIAYVVASHADDLLAIDWGDVRLPWIATALLLAVGSQLGMYLRWQCLLPSVKVRPSCREVIRIGFLGSLCNYSPTGSYGGMGVRAIWLVRTYYASKTAAATSVILDRGIGFATLLLTGAAASFLVRSPASRSNDFALTVFRIAAFLLVLVLLAGALVLSHRRSRERLVAGRPWLGRLPIFGSVDPLKHLASAFAISCCSQFTAVASLCSVARAFGRSGLGIAENALVLSLTEIATALAPTPGGIGVREAVLCLSYDVVGGVTGGQAAVIALGHRGVILLALTIGIATSVTGDAVTKGARRQHG